MIQIDKLIGEARINKSTQLEVLKLMKAEFLKAQISSTRKIKNPDNKKLSEIPLSEDEQLGVIRSMIKSRKDSIEKYRAASRDDLADQEDLEVVVLSHFLPKEPDRKDILEKLKNEIPEGSAMGPAMGIAKKLFPGVSGGLLSSVVKEILGL
jgi:uncharacterized protein YqeY